MLKSYFGNSAAEYASHILLKTGDPLDKINRFVDNFGGFVLEKTADSVQAKGNELSHLAYTIFKRITREFPDAEVTPETTFSEVGIKPDEFEYALMIKEAVENSGFLGALPSEFYDEILKKDVSFAIGELAKANGLIVNGTEPSREI